MTTLFSGKEGVKARALFVGERIDLRSLEAADRLAIAPLVVNEGAGGNAVLFRYGVVVVFGLSADEETLFLERIRSLINTPWNSPESEELELRVDAAHKEGVENGVVYFRQFSVDRLQLVADILAKSVVLSYYEKNVAAIFDNLEPLAANLQRGGSGGYRGKDLLRYIGSTLLVHHKMVGRVEVSEKPDLMWEHPELERLYLRLQDEYEVTERHRALERKLELIARTAETLVDLMRHRSTLRVEWYIVILIVAEILLTLFDLV